jgi:CSLREA domain-containing protein
MAMTRQFPQLLNRTQRSPPHRRRVTPCVEALEDRCVPAAPIVVNTLADTFDLNPNVTSLREAINIANGFAGDDVITFLPGLTGTIQLSSALPDLNSNIDIQGPGANVLAVRRNAGGDYRILLINAATVAISGLTLTNGNTPGDGGAILNGGTLTLSNSTLSGNHATYGGGISNQGTLTLSNSTLSGNSAGLSGGAILNGGMLTLSNSTLSGNHATFSGGGLYNFTKGSNSATLTNATITANRADTTAPGGGIFTVGTLMLRNTIVAGNSHGTAGARDDIFGAVGASAFNLVGDGTGLSGITNNDANGNQVGVTGSNPNPIDPRLGPLQDNGGPTFTHALLSDSPAIDRGLAPGLAPAADQRGVGRSGAADVGAFEFTPPPPPAPPPPVVQARAIVAALVNKKMGKRRRLFVRVSFADTGALKAEVRSPFQKPAFRRILVAVFDSDGDGVADTVRLTARQGKTTWTRLVAL